jgi:hypothetical protein
MTPEAFIPDTEKIKATSAKVKVLCVLRSRSLRDRMDAEILILDDIIAQLDEQIRSSPVYAYRLNRAKRLLNQNRDDLLN